MGPYEFFIFIVQNYSPYEDAFLEREELFKELIGLNIAYDNRRVF